MALHGHNESTHWITPSVIQCSFWSIRKCGGQQLLYRPHSFLIRIRAAIKEPFRLWQNYRWDGDLWGCGYCPGAGLGLTERRRWELFCPLGKEVGVRGSCISCSVSKGIFREWCDSNRWCWKCVSAFRMRWNRHLHAPAAHWNWSGDHI